MKTFTILLCLTVGSVFVNAQNPGMQIKVTSWGLDLISRVIWERVDDHHRSIRLPNFSKGKLSVSNFRLNSLRLGTTTFTTRLPNIFTAVVPSAQLRIASASWSYEQDFYFFSHTFTGSVSASATGVRISQDIHLTRDWRTGKPTFHVGRCIADISDFDVQLDVGVLSVVVDLIIPFFHGLIEDTLQDQICSTIREAFQNEARSLTSAVNVQFPFLLNTNIDLGLTRSPSVTGFREITASLEGRCYRRSSPSESIPVYAPALPSDESTNFMARILISDYVLNSLFYAMYRDNRFTGPFSGARINDLVRSALSSVGVEPSATNYQIVISATSPPVAEFNSSGITIYGPIALTLNSLSDFGPTLLFPDLPYNVKILARLSVVSGRIVGRVVSIEVGSADSGLPINEVDALLEEALPDIFLPAVNAVAESGFKFPEYFDYRVGSMFVSYEQRALDVRATFSYA